jgi:ATP-binding cassette, subfamily B, bacterial PglK
MRAGCGTLTPIMKRYLEDFWFVLGDGQRALPALALMMFSSAFLDLLGLGLIAPLVVALTSGDTAGSGLLASLARIAASVHPTALITAIMMVFLIKAVVGYQTQKIFVRFSESQRGRLMERLMAAYLAKPYEYHLSRNTADMVNTTIQLTWSFSSGILSTVLRLFTDGMMFLLVVGFLATVSWQAVLAIGGFLVLLMGLYSRLVKFRLASIGAQVTNAGAMIIREVNHGLGALREVRILGIEKHCLDQLRLQATRFAEGNAAYGALAVVPRYIIECGTVALLLSIALLVTAKQLEPAAVVPVLGLFGIAAIRLMPGVTGIVSSINSLRVNRSALSELSRDLRELAPVESRLGIRRGGTAQSFRELRFENVTYTYPAGRSPAIENVSFVIRAGQSIGLIGRSGSGKSTTADVLLGLLVPQAGRILLDGHDIHSDPRAWMNRLAYIPQTIYLTDDTLQSNIAFGVPQSEVDVRKVKAAVRTAQLEEVVNGLPQGLDTVIGERGARLSGGQRQRVALARAFYYDRDVIVMDEATASLDTETEQEVVRAIRTLHGKKTLIIIAHRLSTLAGCDFVVQLRDGLVVSNAPLEQTSFDASADVL